MEPVPAQTIQLIAVIKDKTNEEESVVSEKWHYNQVQRVTKESTVGQ
jgi:hypothetical protein